MFKAVVRSKIAPTHREPFGDIAPRFISWELIGQCLPPKENEMLTTPVHAT